MFFYLSHQLSYFAPFNRGPEGLGYVHEIVRDPRESVGSSSTPLAEEGETAQEMVDLAYLSTRPLRAPVEPVVVVSNTPQALTLFPLDPRPITATPSLLPPTSSHWVTLPTFDPATASQPVQPGAEVSRTPLTLFPLDPSNLATPPPTNPASTPSPIAAGPLFSLPLSNYMAPFALHGQHARKCWLKRSTL
ncbi:hypothetical protein PCASD_07389 [Puccinia coronata f. sp. avenae]|uniref:Uncharacterized protein n=1 Tax=Puccinia coronata f. sp. avenae TaxID=200324 RepID=A0A2N5V993_9BASI|nr:hypothetical protein PCASD_07389 [Puccinia coronata f. sp. avenae]